MDRDIWVLCIYKKKSGSLHIHNMNIANNVSPFIRSNDVILAIQVSFLFIGFSKARSRSLLARESLPHWVKTYMFWGLNFNTTFIVL